MVLGILVVIAAPRATAETFRFTAQLTSDADTAAKAAAPRGNAAFLLDTATKIVSWTIEYSGLSGTAHGFACGALDSRAGPPIQRTGTLASPITGSKALTDQEIAGLGAGRWVCVIDGENDDAEIGGALKPAR
jgi:hypothetical protein